MRDGAAGLEVLMLRRHSSLSFHGGAWVFPGGRIDEDDYRSAPQPGVEWAARVAGVREAREEASVDLRVEDLVSVSRWITPVGLPKRFDTWFFAARASDDEVRVDGGEIDDHRWLTPRDAMLAQSRSEIELPPPTFVTLSEVDRYRSVAEALAHLEKVPSLLFFPRMSMVEGGACTLYEGDSGYDSGDAMIPGPRHRLWMVESGWRYECSPELGLSFEP